MTVKAVKLISGEELIGEVVFDSQDTISLKNVLAILIRQDQQGNLGVGFLPFAPYTGKAATFNFDYNKLIFAMEVDDAMKNQYNSIFGGIVTPLKTLIVE